MDVVATLDIHSGDERDLAAILQCEGEELHDRLSPYASAALHEMVEMILGKRVFTRGADILEHRLLLLTLHAFDGRVPDEQKVCSLFQTTASSGRALIRSVMSKYQYQLKAAIRLSLKELLEGAANEGDVLTVPVRNRYLVEELNRELAEINTDLPSVRRRRGTTGTYVIPLSSYDALCERLGAEARHE
jgi:hypothetical protein